MSRVVLLFLLTFAGVATWFGSVNVIAQEIGDRLPGELPIRMRGQLVDPSRVPTLSEIADMVSGDEVRSIAVVRLFSDDNNHYAPDWAGDGRSLTFLRSDLDRGTRKVITDRIDQHSPIQSSQGSANIIYGSTNSFEDLASWSAGKRHLLVFDSTNEPSGDHNVHQASIGLPATRITAGRGVIDFPAMYSDARQSVLVFRRDRELYLAQYASDSIEAQSTQSIGEGEEARPSPDGRLLALVRRNEIGDEYRLVIRELRGTREKLLHIASGSIIRNPRFSPDGRWIAFHSRAITDNRWGLWLVPFNGASKAVAIAGDVRVQEDFRHVGPAWGPRSSGIWCFANTNAQAHYPLQFVPIGGATSFQVDYPREITSASEAAVNPSAARPVILFAGHTSKPRDIFALVLSQMP